MKTKEEIRDWLLNNCLDEEGNLILSNLDFSNFEGDVYMNGLKVKHSLHLNFQEIGGDVGQVGCTIAGRLYQKGNRINGKRC